MSAYNKGSGASGREGGSLKLIIGLGNPGPGYAGTRHNAGFMALNLLAEKNRLERPSNFKSSVVIAGNVEGSKVILAWPLTYMNLSGHAARELYAWYKIPGLENVLVLHDEMDLPPGKVKVTLGGGAAGHNGIASLNENLPGDFARVRIGIGRPPKDSWENSSGSKEWVLSAFADDEAELIHEGLELAADAAAAWIKCGLSASQRLANKRAARPKKAAGSKESSKAGSSAEAEDKGAEDKGAEADRREAERGGRTAGAEPKAGEK